MCGQRAVERKTFRPCALCVPLALCGPTRSGRSRSCAARRLRRHRQTRTTPRRACSTSCSPSPAPEPAASPAQAGEVRDASAMQVRRSKRWLMTPNADGSASSSLPPPIPTARACSPTGRFARSCPAENLPWRSRRCAPPPNRLRQSCRGCRLDQLSRTRVLSTQVEGELVQGAGAPAAGPEGPSMARKPHYFNLSTDTVLIAVEFCWKLPVVIETCASGWEIALVGGVSIFASRISTCLRGVA